jgi:hypothetical protein
MNFEDDKLRVIKEIEDAINHEFHLPVEIIHEEGSHVNSFRMLINGIKYRMMSWESMMYFKQEDIDMIIEDLVVAMYKGEFIKDHNEPSNRNLFL